MVLEQLIRSDLSKVAQYGEAGQQISSGFCNSCTFVNARAAIFTLVAPFQTWLDRTCPFLESNLAHFCRIACFQLSKQWSRSAGQHNFKSPIQSVLENLLWHIRIDLYKRPCEFSPNLKKPFSWLEKSLLRSSNKWKIPSHNLALPSPHENLKQHIGKLQKSLLRSSTTQKNLSRNLTEPFPALAELEKSLEDVWKCSKWPLEDGSRTLRHARKCLKTLENRQTLEMFENARSQALEDARRRSKTLENARRWWKRRFCNTSLCIAPLCSPTLRAWICTGSL